MIIRILFLLLIPSLLSCSQRKRIISHEDKTVLYNRAIDVLFEKYDTAAIPPCIRDVPQVPSKVQKEEP